MLDLVRRVGQLPLHPFLAATYAVVLLYAQNLRELIPPGDVVAPLAVSLVGVAVVFALWWLILRRARVAALATTLFVGLYFGYGYAVQALAEHEIGHVPLLVAWLVMAALGLLVIWLLGPRRDSATPLLNLVLVGLLVVNLASILVFAIQIRAAPDAAPRTGSPPPGGEVTATPDIYWIVLDRYGSRDVIDTYYDHDITPFIEALEERGFYVAEEAAANYLKTAPSLVSARNMEYLDGEALRGRAAADDDWGPLHRDLGDRFALLDLVEQHDYRFVHLGTWWGPTQRHPHAELNFVYDHHASEFATALGRSTLQRALELLGESPVDARKSTHYDRTSWQWERLTDSVDIGGPKLVHAHFSLPHEPYVFDADGSYVSEALASSRSTEESYARQVEYANAQVLRFIDRALDTDPEHRPVVVIQGEEGPRPAAYTTDEAGFAWTDASDEELHEKFGILSAYHLPGFPGAEAEAAGLYRSITPVNQFRVIANTYFGTDYAILPDRHFIWPSDRNVYELIDVTDRVQRIIEGG